MTGRWPVVPGLATKEVTSNPFCNDVVPFLGFLAPYVPFLSSQSHPPCYFQSQTEPSSPSVFLTWLLIPLNFKIKPVTTFAQKDSHLWVTQEGSQTGLQSPQTHVTSLWSNKSRPRGSRASRLFSSSCESTSGLQSSSS